MASALRKLNLMHGTHRTWGFDWLGTGTHFLDFEHIKAITEAYHLCEAKPRELTAK